MGYRTQFWTILSVLILINQPLLIKSSDNEIENTFKLLKESENAIKFPNHSKNLILVLGNTGAGKSTFVQWLAGDNSKLISKEVAGGTGEYLIEDGKHIGNSTTVSKTLFPEVILDEKHNLTILYDCPGFSDTRSTSYDIAATYFIKEVAEFADSLKLIFVISYPSVQKGVDRQDFMKLLRHATDFIQDIDRFQNSIAMVVTKVNNDYIKRGKTFILVSDERITAKIADFLQEVKLALGDRLRKIDISERDKTFYQNAIKFINVLLLKNQETYSRIGIFRRPDEPGPLSGIITLQEGKEHINKILHETLSFTPSANHQFGYTVSDRSKRDIAGLVEEINIIITNNINTIVDKIQSYYSDVSKQISDAIQLLQTARDNVHTNVHYAHQFITHDKVVEEFLSNLMNVVYDFNRLKNFADRNQQIIIQLQITEQFQSILAQGKYFNFLQAVSDRKLQIGPFHTTFDQLNHSLLQSKLNIIKNANNTIPIIANKIEMNIETIAKELKAHYLKQINSLAVENVPLNMVLEYLDSTILINKVNNEKDVSAIINEYINKLGLTKRQSLSAIHIFEKNLQFLSILSNNDDQSSVISSFIAPQWVRIFENLKSFFNETKVFYRFVNSLYERLSQFDIQNDTSLYNVAYLENWGKPGQTQGIYITRDNFKLFLTQLKPYNIAEYESIENLAITEPYLKTLNNLLTITLKNQIELECTSSSVLRVRGDFIKFSDIFYASGYLRWLCKARLDAINIFATNKVFIDADFDGTGTKIKFTLIAPKWEIIGNRKITLDGSPGEDHPKARAYGSDGLAGNPGGAAGNFFSIGAEIKNIKSLTVSAQGGRGGRGQDGGDGVNGARGKNAEISKNFQRKLLDSDSSCHILWAVDSPEDLGCPTKHEYIYYGTSGNTGGDGGDGGQGGYGGPAGNIIMYYIDSNERPNIQIQTGLKGYDGKGGRGGSGGFNGDDAKVTCLIDFTSDDCKIDSRSNSGKKAPSGSKGIDGKNSVGLKRPENPVEFQRISDLVTDYKVYLIVGLQSQFRRETILQFLRQINGSVDKSSYNTQSLLHALLELEKQNYNLQKLDDKIILYFYETMLKNILDFVERLPRDDSSKQQKIVLGYLYTTILSKISALKKNSKSELIIDAEKYLNIVQNDISTLSILQEKSNKAQVIDQYRKNYKSGIDKKINEAKDLIQYQILSEIQNMNIQTKQEINKLIDETKVLLDRAHDEKENLMKKKQEMKDAIVKSWVLTSFDMFGKVLSCFGGPASAIGSTISTASQIVQPLVLNNDNEITQTIHIPDGVLSTLSSGIKNIKNIKIANLGLSLNYVKKNTDKHDQTFQQDIGNIEAQYNQAVSTSDSTGVNNLENQLKTQLKDEKTELEEAGLDSSNLDRTTKISNTILELGETAVNIYGKINNDKRVINEIEDALEQAQQQIQSMKAYQTKIYDTLIPALENMQTNLNEVNGELKQKSQVALNVQKWQIQSALKDMKLWVRQFTKGFNVEEDLTHCVEKLEEAMTTLIDIYDRMQSFEEQKLLADYIAHISSATAIKIDINDQELRKGVNDLERVIRSNIILDRYKTAIGALKQQVFPMADYYLSEPLLPSSLAIENNFQSLVTKAIENVNKIGTKIQEYKASITQTDAFISKGWFNSEFVTSKPFFVWKNTQHQHMIQELLSGNKVLINVNILSSDPDKDAIKFNQIGINFYSPYPNITSGIKNILKGFFVSATHLGNSYYRYKNGIYLINSDSQNIEFSFEKDKDGRPVHTNGVYDKITAGKLMLSPYAMWEIQLINVANQVSFSYLRKYADYVNLELVGYGNYLKKGIEIPNVDEYYQLDESYLY